MAFIVVLITGGNRGLGQALVKRFLAQPNHVREIYPSGTARSICRVYGT